MAKGFNAAAIRTIADRLGIARKNAGPLNDLYGAGYDRLVYRAHADENPYIRMNANVGSHSDLVGGGQAVERLEAIKPVLPKARISALMARTGRPLFVTDDEINNPYLMALVLRDRDLSAKVNRISEKFPDREINSGQSIASPLTSIAQRHLIERALRARGYDSLVYPNMVERPPGVDMGSVMETATKAGDRADVYRNLNTREGFARMILNSTPVVEGENAIKYNPSLSIIDYGAYRLPLGPLSLARDYITPGYSSGGRVC